jgi:hypothetical protein
MGWTIMRMPALPEVTQSRLDTKLEKPHPQILKLDVQLDILEKA